MGMECGIITLVCLLFVYVLFCLQRFLLGEYFCVGVKI